MWRKRRDPEELDDIGQVLSARITERVRESLVGKPRLPAGTVTILFTDVEGSTALVRNLGDRGAHAMLRRHDELVRGAITGCEGIEIEHAGDSFMVAFPTAGAALGCALQIHGVLEAERRSEPQTPLVRVGMDTGEVIAEERGYFGSTVFRAARVADLAAGGQTLVAEPTKVLGETAGYSFSEAGEVELKGLAGRHRLFNLIGGPRA
jgi:class 3 adenylate cyclase